MATMSTAKTDEVNALVAKVAKTVFLRVETIHNS